VDGAGEDAGTACAAASALEAREEDGRAGGA
jgi:hypothetical protein